MPVTIYKTFMQLDNASYEFLGRPPSVAILYSGMDLYVTFFPNRGGRIVSKHSDYWRVSLAGCEYLIPGSYSLERCTSLLYPCLIVRGCLTLRMVDTMKIPRGVSDDPGN